MIILDFDTEEQARVFRDWMDNSGEQHYFDYIGVTGNENGVDRFRYGARTRSGNYVITGEKDES